ncbi:hypothetical protein OHA77_27460 [Streptosporangium sp. NBC_01639]|uniref:hypothetical protein n=1 Tax=Streptosporangium sp. NBC_01639 TaxID=2975948 RepID=UPI00386425A4|nr:hypothetical protein OHA77_27460 [Streptosporangium sp. NBC_01639]
MDRVTGRGAYPRIPNRDRVTRVRRTSRSYAATVSVSETATITTYLTGIGACQPTTPYATATTIGWCRTYSGSAAAAR